MSERKVLNKYIPPDYDPSKAPPKKKKKFQGPNGGKSTVRLMTPFSMKCNTCGEYIYKGKKFNARKEKTGEKYFSIDILRFYIRCTRCAAEITFVTDPKHTDYAAEKGASRNFEPWREQKLKAHEDPELDGEDPANETPDNLKLLEQKTLDTKRRMEISDTLDELREQSARRSRIDIDDAIAKLESVRKEKQEADEAEQQELLEEAKKLFASHDGAVVRRMATESTTKAPPSATELAENVLGETKLPSFQPVKRAPAGAGPGRRKRAVL
ncbi:splicing factor [Schizosaccharomyces japonicus yFS275]|uniref:Splicing factor YJU2 n=1 Tax=Schizosaccharomyces japonicus (strain yFS275 / FY16936) TaxID=402676 RepID=B6JY45_SCHJY|nr:splicing factor [Schizosaccharomyces japonicus yFS275]EEB06463.1 splicing factor [Schizosaccharomyces japonicus yFS275]